MFLAKGSPSFPLPAQFQPFYNAFQGNKKCPEDFSSGHSFRSANDAHDLADGMIQAAVIGHSPVTQPLILHLLVQGHQPQRLIRIGDVPLQQRQNDILLAAAHEHAYALLAIDSFAGHGTVDIHRLDGDAALGPDRLDLLLGNGIAMASVGGMLHQAAIVDGGLEF